MKKCFKILAICTLSLTATVACKKNEASDELKTSTPPANFTPPKMENQEELTKESQSKPLTNLALSENHFDFGKIKKGAQVQHDYEVTNTGKNPLIISQVKPGCGCTVPDFTKDPILPGKKGKITLHFDSSNFDGVVNKQAEVFSNVEKSPIILTFTANIQPQ